VCKGERLAVKVKKGNSKSKIWISYRGKNWNNYRTWNCCGCCYQLCWWWWVCCGSDWCAVRVDRDVPAVNREAGRKAVKLFI
jgi:hypothetical protein